MALHGLALAPLAAVERQSACYNFCNTMDLIPNCGTAADGDRVSTVSAVAAVRGCGGCSGCRGTGRMSEAVEEAGFASCRYWRSCTAGMAGMAGCASCGRGCSDAAAGGEERHVGVCLGGLSD